MSKEFKGNAKKYDVLSKIKNNMSKYDTQLCTYKMEGMTVNDMISFKKQLPADVKLCAVPTKVALFALKDVVDVSSANLKGNLYFAFSKDVLKAVSLSNILPKALRHEFTLSGIVWNGKLETSKEFLDLLVSNGISSEQDLRAQALFNLFAPYIQFKNLLKMRADML